MAHAPGHLPGHRLAGLSKSCRLGFRVTVARMATSTEAGVPGREIKGEGGQIQ